MANLPKYSELSPAGRQKLMDANVLNGCGPSNWRGPRPNWFFKASCLEHDYNYAVGNTEADRRWADWGFYTAMIKDTYRLPWWQRPFARFQAWMFYTSVRFFGKSAYNYGDRPLNLDEMVKNGS